MNRELWLAARSGDEDKLALALKAGAAVNSRDESFHGWTALHRAADRGHAEIVSVYVYV